MLSSPPPPPPQQQQDDRMETNNNMTPLHISSPPFNSKRQQWMLNHIQKQCIYLVILLVTLGMIEQATDGSLWKTVHQHEPSVRIFRALSEMALLLLCTSGCVFTWSRYLGQEETERLMFYLPLGRGTDTPEVTLRQDDDNIFDNVQGDDMFAEGERTEMDTEDDGEVADSPSSTSRVPSPATLLSGSLDLFLWILVTLILYALAATAAVDIDSDWHFLSRIAAPTFPLLLFLYCGYKAAFPFRKRLVVFQVLSFTLLAPSYSVSFRDGMIGDILTSTVRPLQDIAFTTCYILFGLQGWWSSSYFSLTDSNNFLEAADANVPTMERSWLLHTLILPACMISPLWYRFLQNMRQVYDNKRRWPYLGNAWKYFCAAQVAMVGVYHPHVKSNPLWLFFFALATIYQIWWDVIMDWGLLVRNGGSWKLRNRRLYPSTTYYWALIIVNALLRFCWTLNFVPTRYLSVAGVLMRDGGGQLLAPMIASAEIVRRSLWALLRVEWESIKDGGHHDDDKLSENDSMEGMIPMELSGATSKRRRGYLALSDLSSVADVELLGELCFYTSTFALLGIIIAAHRGTM